jgi:hypothetical protein
MPPQQAQAFTEIMGDYQTHEQTLAFPADVRVAMLTDQHLQTQRPPKINQRGFTSRRGLMMMIKTPLAPASTIPKEAELADCRRAAFQRPKTPLRIYNNIQNALDLRQDLVNGLGDFKLEWKYILRNHPYMAPEDLGTDHGNASAKKLAKP